MKKYVSLLLLSALLFTSCSSAKETEDTEETEAAVPAETVETVPETEPETAAPHPENVEVFQYETLELSKEPVFEDGVFLLYFTDDDIWFEADAAFRLGIRSSEEAYTIDAVQETALYPDMMVGDEYCGIALRPSEDIPAGEYRFSVTFEQYICDFEYTIQ